MHKSTTRRRSGPHQAVHSKPRIPLVATAAAIVGLLIVLVPDMVAAAPVKQPGTLACTTITGTLTFRPPLTSAGGRAGVVGINAKVSGCTASGGGKAPTKGTATGSLSLASNSCSELASPPPGLAVTIVGKWSPGTITKTTVTFTNFKTSLTPVVAFSVGGTGTSGSGSYMGTDNGAVSKATVTSNETLSQALASCGSPKGLKKLSIASGSAHLG